MAVNQDITVPLFPGYPDFIRPTLHNLMCFLELASAFAASQFGQTLDDYVLRIIIKLAAPYHLSANTYMTRYYQDVSVEEHLLNFEPNFRCYQWWWGDFTNGNAVVEMAALDYGPRISASCVTLWDDEVAPAQQSSQVYARDDSDDATWYVMRLEIDNHGVCVDLKVHPHSTMLEILLFSLDLFDTPERTFTSLLLWGLDGEGKVDVDDTMSHFLLSTTSESSVLNNTFENMFGVMEEAATRMQANLLLDICEHHLEWYKIIAMVGSLC